MFVVFGVNVGGGLTFCFTYKINMIKQLGYWLTYERRNQMKPKEKAKIPENVGMRRAKKTERVLIPIY